MAPNNVHWSELYHQDQIRSQTGVQRISTRETEKGSMDFIDKKFAFWHIVLFSTKTKYFSQVFRRRNIQHHKAVEGNKRISKGLGVQINCLSPNKIQDCCCSPSEWAPCKDQTKSAQFWKSWIKTNQQKNTCANFYNLLKPLFKCPRYEKNSEREWINLVWQCSVDRWNKSLTLCRNMPQ